MKEYFEIIVLGLICCFIIKYLYDDRRLFKFKINGGTLSPTINKEIYVRYKTSQGFRCVTVTDNALLLTLRKSVITKLWGMALELEAGEEFTTLTIVTPNKNTVVFEDGATHVYELMN